MLKNVDIAHVDVPMRPTAKSSLFKAMKQLQTYTVAFYQNLTGGTRRETRIKIRAQAPTLDRRTRHVLCKMELTRTGLNLPMPNPVVNRFKQRSTKYLQFLFTTSSSALSRLHREECNHNPWQPSPLFAVLTEKLVILTSLRLWALLKPSASAYQQSAVIDELVLWDLEVVRRWAFAYPAGRVVMGTVAWAEPSSVVTSVRDRYAA